MTAWRRASRCDSCTCVEARRIGDVIEVRDSKSPDGPILSFDLDEWDTFLVGVREGEFTFPDELPNP